MEKDLLAWAKKAGIENIRAYRAAADDLEKNSTQLLALLYQPEFDLDCVREAERV